LDSPSKSHSSFAVIAVLESMGELSNCCPSVCVHQSFAYVELPTVFLCLCQSRLAGGIMLYWAVCPSIRVLPNLWTWYSENTWTNFAANWHKWSTGQVHGTVNFWGLGVKGQGHRRSRSQEVKVRLGGLVDALFLTPFGPVGFKNPLTSERKCCKQMVQKMPKIPSREDEKFRCTVMCSTGSTEDANLRCKARFVVFVLLFKRLTLL